MFWFKKEPEKPNYAKIIGITLGIIAAIAAAGYAAYWYCKKNGICCCICKSEDVFDDEEELEDADDEIEVEIEEEPETEAKAE